jgi:hypothetical protein
MSGKLYGEYETIIDTCFADRPKSFREVVKAVVAEADREGRRGLSRLQRYLRDYRCNVTPVEHILRACEADQDYYDDLVKDWACIDKQGSGYRVRVTVEAQRISKTCDSHVEAVKVRDRLRTLNDKLSID